MALRAAESRSEKCLHQFPGEGVTDYKPAETDHVQIIVLDALVRRKGFVNQTGADARNLVRNDRRPDATPADGHAPRYFSTRDGARQRHDKVRIVIVRLRLAVAEVDHLLTGLAQLPYQVLL
jgi:hypothetical protein